MNGHARHDALVRAALVVAAGGVLIGLTQRAPELGLGLTGKLILAAGGLIIGAGLVMAVRALRRPPGEG